MRDRDGNANRVATGVEAVVTCNPVVAGFRHGVDDRLAEELRRRRVTGSGRWFRSLRDGRFQGCDQQVGAVETAGAVDGGR
jgi:hypothetical protein